MNAKQLLTPRYEVIAPFPGMEHNYHFKVGDIYTDDGYHTVIDENCKSKFFAQFDEYPHLFRRVAWFEFRTVEQMPKYIMHSQDEDKEVIEIVKWDMIHSIGISIDRKRFFLKSSCIDKGYIPIDQQI